MRNRQALNLLLAANSVSGIAQGISMLSIPWYFATQTEDYGIFGMVYIGITLATAFWGLYAGTLIDRYSRKAIFLTINWAGAILLGGVSLFGLLTGHVADLMIYLVFGGTIFIYNIHFPCMYAFGQEISERENFGKLNSLFEIQVQATSILAGGAGALLLSGTENGILGLSAGELPGFLVFKPWKIHEIFFLDFLTYLLSLVLIFPIRYNKIIEMEVHKGSILKRLNMGIQFLRENPLVFWFGNLTFSIFVILLIEVQLLLSPYIKNHLLAGADVYAISEVFYSIGALGAGFFIRKALRKFSPTASIIVMMFLIGGFLIWVTFSKSVSLFFIFSFIFGITNAGTRILRATWLFNKIPNNMMGRTGSVFQVINILTRSVFIFFFSLPFFLQGSNIAYAYMIGGIFILVSALPLMLNFKKLKLHDSN
jgi:MFS transporter, DHA3 family, macrolide efflux protein